MKLMRADSWPRYREVESIVALSISLPRQNQVLLARSKSAFPTKQPRNWQDEFNVSPSIGQKEENSSEFSQNADIAEDASSLPSDIEIKSEAQRVSRVTATDVSPVLKREVILMVCVTTCAALLALGAVIQKAINLAAESGWPVPDSTLLFKNNVEFWHLEVILGLVMIVSISRQLLLILWSEFSESSNIANEEVLGPLRLIDYVIVAALPAISEELLFRGWLLPLCGLNWKGVTMTGVLFGVLHYSGGRKTAFAIWASMVGILYGIACLTTHSVMVPMAAHSANNLIGALIWRWKQQRNSAHED